MIKIRMFTLPNAITMLNLVLGCAAVVVALSGGGRLNVVFWLVAAAAVCDFADGMVARLTGQYSELGVQLDSLADMVSFGVVPGAVLWVIYRDSLSLFGGPELLYDILGWLVFAVALFSALRLARFNVEAQQTAQGAHSHHAQHASQGSRPSEFRGLPVPAPAIAIAALGWMWYNGELEAVAYKEVMIAFAALVSYLLICPVPMFSLKFTDFAWRGNEIRYIFIASSALLVILFGMGGIPLAVGLYVVISVARYFYIRWQTRLVRLK